MNASLLASLCGQIAPNGRPVAENFAEWFGNSKVVSTDGAPKKVFHGTRSVFDSFQKRFLGRNVGNDTTRMGHFFTEEASGADLWASWKQMGMSRFDEPVTGQTIVPAYLCICRPTEVGVAQFAELLLSMTKAIDRFIAESVAKGSDGFRIEREHEVWWVPFDPRRIKSAIGNSGIFDPESDDFADRHGWDVPVTRERMRA